MFFRLRLAYNYISMQATDLKINLTANEQQVFNTLTSYTQQLGLTTVMRVAGGWVRDKIMGWESKDIDIALDNMKGEEFVLLLKKHAETRNQKISSFGVTKLNPDLSKHLETATAKIHNNAIDFVNLRSEIYNDKSRIPTIGMGTPLEDALRRDFTINSLFYNINTKQVEDYTERGLNDIANRVIRTPLQPLVTFTDDPLRVLRCFRFRARFNFDIHEQIYQSLSNESVHQALKTKVSKERVGIQMAGTLKAEYALQGLLQIYKYKYWNIIFEVPESCDLKDQHFISSIPQYSFSLIRIGQEVLKTQKLSTQSILLQEEGVAYKDKRPRYTRDQLRLLINLSFITVVYRNYKVTEGKKSTTLIDHMIRNQLKYAAKVSKFVNKIGELTSQLQKILPELTKQNMKVKLIRWLRSAQQKWQIVLLILQTMRILQKSQGFNLLQLRAFITTERLQDTYLTQSFIDGTFLTKRGKKGPIIKIILDNTIIWRALNPGVEKAQFLELFEKNLEFFENDKSYC